MRESIRQLVELCAGTLPIIEPIYEFGSLQVAGQEGYADLRPFFPEKKYVGCDMRPGVGVDEILNLHSIDLPGESVGTVLCFDTLEHVEYPNKALEEIHRILEPNGIAVISSVLDFLIHDHPYDYWRFTPEAFKSILKPFNYSFVGYAGVKDFPHTIVGIGFKGNIPRLEDFTEQFYEWSKNWYVEPNRSHTKLLMDLETLDQTSKEKTAESHKLKEQLTSLEQRLLLTEQQLQLSIEKHKQLLETYQDTVNYTRRVEAEYTRLSAKDEQPGTSGGGVIASFQSKLSNIRAKIK